VYTLHTPKINFDILICLVICSKSSFKKETESAKTTTTTNKKKKKSMNTNSIAESALRATYVEERRNAVFDQVYAANPDIKKAIDQDDEERNLFSNSFITAYNMVNAIIAEEFINLTPEERSALALRMQATSAIPTTNDQNKSVFEQKQVQQDNDDDAPAIDDD
jgi:hypothetical protein